MQSASQKRHFKSVYLGVLHIELAIWQSRHYIAGALSPFHDCVRSTRGGDSACGECSITDGGREQP